MKYVILRARATEKMGLPRFGMRDNPQLTIPEVEVGDLNHQRAANLALRKDVRAVAPVVPMKLIEPSDSGSTQIPGPEGMAWGVEAVAAHTSIFNGDGIIIAVLDTGIDARHPAFAGVELVRKNFTDEADADVNGHGTHCCGTIFGRDINGTRIGIARGIRKALVGKVLGKNGGSSDKMIQAIQWAVNSGATIISMSFGIDFPGYVTALQITGVPTDVATSMALEGYRANVLLFERFAAFIAAQNAFSRTCLLIAAAGNESRRHINSEYKIAVSPPAVADGFISVAAVGKSPLGLTVAPFSNTGARVSGPGVDVHSACLGGGVTSKSGTSMAAPHVAGVAALWAEKLSAGGEINGRFLEDRIIGAATTAGMQPGFAPNDIGAGLVQAPQS